VQVCLIQVPYHVGDDRHGASKGPPRLIQAGLGSILAGRDIAVAVDKVDRETPFRDSASASRAVNAHLATAVKRAIAKGQLPLVLAGSCDVSMGVLAGFEHAGCGVVWIDAHGDFNTPDSTISGYFAGMSLAVITGHCYSNVWAELGDNTPIAETATLMLGVRDLDPAERNLLELSAIHVVGWKEGKPQGDVLDSLDELAGRVREIYLHIDMDALAPVDAPGLAMPPVEGGVSLSEMEEIMIAVAGRFRIRAVTLATYNPDSDQDEKTLRSGLRIMEALAAGLMDRRSPSGAKHS
jgi:arginase